MRHRLDGAPDGAVAEHCSDLQRSPTGLADGLGRAESSFRGLADSPQDRLPWKPHFSWDFPNGDPLGPPLPVLAGTRRDQQ